MRAIERGNSLIKASVVSVLNAGRVATDIEVCHVCDAFAECVGAVKVISLRHSLGGDDVQRMICAETDGIAKASQPTAAELWKRQQRMCAQTGKAGIWIGQTGRGGTLR